MSENIKNIFFKEVFTLQYGISGTLFKNKKTLVKEIIQNSKYTNSISIGVMVSQMFTMPKQLSREFIMVVIELAMSKCEYEVGIRLKIRLRSLLLEYNETKEDVILLKAEDIWSEFKHFLVKPCNQYFFDELSPILLWPNNRLGDLMIRSMFEMLNKNDKNSSCTYVLPMHIKELDSSVDIWKNLLNYLIVVNNLSKQDAYVYLKKLEEERKISVFTTTNPSSIPTYFFEESICDNERLNDFFSHLFIFSSARDFVSIAKIEYFDKLRFSLRKEIDLMKNEKGYVQITLDESLNENTNFHTSF